VVHKGVRDPGAGPKGHAKEDQVVFILLVLVSELSTRC